MYKAQRDPLIISMLSGHDSLLDFGCGSGDYARYLSNRYSKIDLYDFEYVINQIEKDIKSIDGVNVHHEWDLIKNNKYSDIIVSLTLQHIHPDQLKEILFDLSQMSNNLIIKSRYEFNPYISKMMDFKNIHIERYILQYFNEIEKKELEPGQCYVAKYEPKS